jgi:hypothetical protein
LRFHQDRLAAAQKPGEARRNLRDFFTRDDDSNAPFDLEVQPFVGLSFCGVPSSTSRRD